MLSTASGLACDEQPSVRASAARTIGVYILIPVFREVNKFLKMISEYVIYNIIILGCFICL